MAKVKKAGGRKGGYKIVNSAGRKIGWSATKRRAKARARKA
jgi:hypothetical protein